MSAELVKPAEIQIPTEDRLRRENLILKEEVIRRRAQEGLLNIAKQAETMMNDLSARMGVDLKKYEINWDTGEVHLPEQKEELQDGEAQSAG